MRHISYEINENCDPPSDSNQSLVVNSYNVEVNSPEHSHCDRWNSNTHHLSNYWCVIRKHNSNTKKKAQYPLITHNQRIFLEQIVVEQWLLRMLFSNLYRWTSNYRNIKLEWNCGNHVYYYTCRFPLHSIHADAIAGWAGPVCQSHGAPIQVSSPFINTIAEGVVGHSGRFAIDTARRTQARSGTEPTRNSRTPHAMA